MTVLLTKKTFSYLQNARKNTNKKEWFLKNKDLYEQHVRKPFEYIVDVLQKEVQADLPRILISKKSITRPLRPSNRAENGVIKDFISINFAEKKTSLFEWNPGVYLHFGAKPEDNFLGVGLYMVSSRQMSLMRTKIADDFDTIDEILTDKKFKRVWKKMAGEKMKKPPKGFPLEQPYSEILMHKQFYVYKTYKTSEMIKKNFAKSLAKDLKTAMPLLNWIRQTVGTYSR